MNPTSTLGRARRQAWEANVNQGHTRSAREVALILHYCNTGRNTKYRARHRFSNPHLLNDQPNLGKSQKYVRTPTLPKISHIFRQRAPQRERVNARQG